MRINVISLGVILPCILAAEQICFMKTQEQRVVECQIPFSFVNHYGEIEISHKPLHAPESYPMQLCPTKGHKNLTSDVQVVGTAVCFDTRSECNSQCTFPFVFVDQNAKSTIYFEPVTVQEARPHGAAFPSTTLWCPFENVYRFGTTNWSVVSHCERKYCQDSFCDYPFVHFHGISGMYSKHLSPLVHADALALDIAPVSSPETHWCPKRLSLYDSSHSWESVSCNMQQRELSDLKCITDGGYVPYDTPCMPNFVYLGVTYSSCVAIDAAEPIMDPAIDPKLPLNEIKFNAENTHWCATVKNYNTETKVRKLWGYCNPVSCGICIGTNGVACVANESNTTDHAYCAPLQPGGMPYCTTENGSVSQCQLSSCGLETDVPSAFPSIPPSALPTSIVRQPTFNPTIFPTSLPTTNGPSTSAPAPRILTTNPSISPSEAPSNIEDTPAPFSSAPPSMSPSATPSAKLTLVISAAFSRDGSLIDFVFNSKVPTSLSKNFDCYMVSDDLAGARSCEWHENWMGFSAFGASVSLRAVIIRPGSWTTDTVEHQVAIHPPLEPYPVASVVAPISINTCNSKFEIGIPDALFVGTLSSIRFLTSNQLLQQSIFNRCNTLQGSHITRESLLCPFSALDISRSLDSETRISVAVQLTTVFGEVFLTDEVDIAISPECPSYLECFQSMPLLTFTVFSNESPQLSIRSALKRSCVFSNISGIEWLLTGDLPLKPNMLSVSPTNVLSNKLILKGLFDETSSTRATINCTVMVNGTFSLALWSVVVNRPPIRVSVAGGNRLISSLTESFRLDASDSGDPLADYLSPGYIPPVFQWTCSPVNYCKLFTVFYPDQVVGGTSREGLWIEMENHLVTKSNHEFLELKRAMPLGNIKFSLHFGLTLKAGTEIASLGAPVTISLSPAVLKSAAAYIAAYPSSLALDSLNIFAGTCGGGVPRWSVVETRTRKLLNISLYQYKSTMKLNASGLLDGIFEVMLQCGASTSTVVCELKPGPTGGEISGSSSNVGWDFHLWRFDSLSKLSYVLQLVDANGYTLMSTAVKSRGTIVVFPPDSEAGFHVVGIVRDKNGHHRVLRKSFFSKKRRQLSEEAQYVVSSWVQLSGMEVAKDISAIMNVIHASGQLEMSDPDGLCSIQLCILNVIFEMFDSEKSTVSIEDSIYTVVQFLGVFHYFLTSFVDVSMCLPVQHHVVSQVSSIMDFWLLNSGSSSAYNSKYVSAPFPFVMESAALKSSLAIVDSLWNSSTFIPQCIEIPRPTWLKNILCNSNDATSNFSPNDVLDIISEGILSTMKDTPLTDGVKHFPLNNMDCFFVSDFLDSFLDFSLGDKNQTFTMAGNLKRYWSTMFNVLAPFEVLSCWVVDPGTLFSSPNFQVASTRVLKVSVSQSSFSGITGSNNSDFTDEQEDAKFTALFILSSDYIQYSNVSCAIWVEPSWDTGQCKTTLHNTVVHCSCGTSGVIGVVFYTVDLPVDQSSSVGYFILGGSIVIMAVDFLFLGLFFYSRRADYQSAHQRSTGLVLISLHRKLRERALKARGFSKLAQLRLRKWSLGTESYPSELSKQSKDGPSMDVHYGPDRLNFLSNHLLISIFYQYTVQFPRILRTVVLAWSMNAHIVLSSAVAFFSDLDVFVLTLCVMLGSLVIYVVTLIVSMSIPRMHLRHSSPPCPRSQMALEKRRAATEQDYLNKGKQVFTDAHENLQRALEGRSEWTSPLRNQVIEEDAEFVDGTEMDSRSFALSQDKVALIEAEVATARDGLCALESFVLDRDVTRRINAGLNKYQFIMDVSETGAVILKDYGEVDVLQFCKNPPKLKEVLRVADRFWFYVVILLVLVTLGIDIFVIFATFSGNRDFLEHFLILLSVSLAIDWCVLSFGRLFFVHVFRYRNDPYTSIGSSQDVYPIISDKYVEANESYFSEWPQAPVLKIDSGFDEDDQSVVEDSFVGFAPEDGKTQMNCNHDFVDFDDSASIVSTVSSFARVPQYLLDQESPSFRARLVEQEISARDIQLLAEGRLSTMEVESENTF